MSAVFANSFYNTNTSRVVPMNNVQEEKPCLLSRFIVWNYYGTTLGWNAVLVGLLSCVLAILFLLTCLYYLAFRRRFVKQMSDDSSPMPLVDKAAATTIPVTSASQSMSTTILNEPGKETKITTYSEHASGPVAAGDFAITMPNTGNGHVTSANGNGLLTNGSTDASELRLLQHEHH